MKNTVLLTGLPRSGTTLTCALLNGFEDTVGLPEPIHLSSPSDRQLAVREIEDFVVRTRESLLMRGEAISRVIGGSILDNFFDPPSEGGGLRQSRAEVGPVRIEKPLSAGFSLIVKHPAEFSALMDLLLPRGWAMAAVVRHPLAVLASWQTVAIPVNQGHMPMAEILNPELASLLADIPDCLDRQVALLGWLLRRYTHFLPGRVIRYEDMIASPGQALHLLSPHAKDSGPGLKEYAPAARYPGVDLARLARALLAISDEAEVFYPGFAESLSPWLG